MPRVLLLIPSATYRAPDFMAAARNLGVEVVVGCDRRPVLEDVAPGRTLEASFSRPEEGARAIEAFAREYPLDAVVAVDDAGTVSAARACELLDLPHNPVEAVEATRNKHLLRQRLAAGGVLSPDYRLLSLDDDPRVAAAEVDYPCVLKPLSLSASRGVMRADDAAGFVSAFERLRALLTDPEVASECGETARHVLVEGYIPGEEVSLEGMLVNGRLLVLALFDKPDPLEGPFFEETLYVTPSRLDAETQDEVARTAERAARALGLRDGPLHAELRLNAEGAWPVDVAARSIGGLCSRTLSFGTGMSLEELILRHATRAPIPSFEREGAASGVMMIPIPRGGVLSAVRGVEQAEETPGVTEVTVTMRVGQEVVPLPEGSEYLGFIFARAETPDAVEQGLRAAHAALHFEIVSAEEYAASAAAGRGEAGRGEARNLR